MKVEGKIRDLKENIEDLIETIDEDYKAFWVAVKLHGRGDESVEAFLSDVALDMLRSIEDRLREVVSDLYRVVKEVDKR